MVVLLIATTLGALNGCTGNRYRDRQIIGTAGGAAVGGLVGHAIGGNTAGTIIGGAIGAGAGSAITSDPYY
ncbi:MAG: glycine zipper 2TM domain-containing protein [Gammaproteobacteria bacterium]|nr:glycine zipper 2TM domain-containing protein [Gammaproteobacteria bacterium]